MKKIILAVVAGAATLVSVPALADNGHHRGWNKHHWKHQHRHHGHYGQRYGHAYAPGPVVVVPAPVYRYAPPPRVVYAPPPPVVVHPAPAYYPAPVYRHAEPSVSFRINVPL